MPALPTPRAVIVKGVYRSYGAMGGGGSLMDAHEFWKFVKDARLPSSSLKLSALRSVVCTRRHGGASGDPAPPFACAAQVTWTSSS